MAETANPPEQVEERDRDWLSDLQREVWDKGRSPITFLPLLGLPGYIRERRSHLLASYPKGGKTELMLSIMLGWPEEKVLYITEEDRETWGDRLYDVPPWPGDVQTVYALGWEVQRIMNECLAWEGSVIVIDTIKLLGIEDENDASKVQAALTPFVKMARTKKLTLIFVHHGNKHGGAAGRGVTGSHAFISIVDIFLEIEEYPRAADDDPRRLLSGRGKIRAIETLEYVKELKGDGLMHAQGPALLNANLAVQNAMSTSWKTQADISADAGLGSQTVYRRLMELAQKGKAERDPPVAKGRPPADKPIRWRLT